MLGLIEQHLDKVEQVERTNAEKAYFSVTIERPIKDLIQSMFNCITITQALRCHSKGGRITEFGHPHTMLIV
ncbi:MULTISPECIES: hypothetical protein [unclassified Pseudoalteromonas]|uniref:hypothetical protein n=1 Tax=unclassified Pseudoalteromonas TaxID=194690 RepID=UPI002175905F|nr:MULTISPECIES: hypothetical protein [unclassified Pseudoalteromonas]